MEHYSYTDLTEFFFLAQSAMDTQFQYWMTVTFAAVVAGFVAGGRLTRPMRFLAAALYLLASVVLVLRFLSAARTVASIQDYLVVADAFVIEPFGLSLAALRMPLFLLGTAAALFFLLRPQRGHHEQNDAE